MPLTFTVYKNIAGNSGVIKFATFTNAIIIIFKDSGKQYVYSDGITGKAVVDGLKNLALIGRGLATYIGRNQKTLKFTAQ